MGIFFECKALQIPENVVESLVDVTNVVLSFYFSTVFEYYQTGAHGHHQLLINRICDPISSRRLGT
jgi:hypothetical protein